MLNRILVQGPRLGLGLRRYHETQILINSGRASSGTTIGIGTRPGVIVTSGSRSRSRSSGAHAHGIGIGTLGTPITMIGSMIRGSMLKGILGDSGIRSERRGHAGHALSAALHERRRLRSAGRVQCSAPSTLVCVFSISISTAAPEPDFGFES